MFSPDESSCYPMYWSCIVHIAINFCLWMLLVSDTGKLF